MYKLMSQIKEDAKKKKITNKMIATRLKVSNTSVSNYFKNNGQQISFENFVSLIELVYEQDIERNRLNGKLSSFVAKNVRKDNDRVMLEYFAGKGENNLLETVLNRVKKDEYQSLLGCIYQLLLNRKRKSITPEEFYFQLEDLKKESKLNHPEESVMLKIATIYGNWDLQGYNLIEMLVDRALEEIKSISNEFIRKAYRIRAIEMLVYAYLKQNKIELVEKYSNQLLTIGKEEMFPIVINSIYSTLAEVYSFTDYDKSLTYINKALDLNRKLLSSHKMRKQGLEATHDFIKICNGDYNELFLTDISERAHLAARKGEKREALEILKQIEKKRDGLSPHQTFYKALALQDKSLLGDAFSEFIRTGDLFYAQLPLKLLDSGKYN